MICRMCVQGSKWNRAWRAGGGAHFLNQAGEAHGMCTGCDCQHAVGVDSLTVMPHVD